MNKKIESINNKDIESSLTDNTRQYFAGHLSKPQNLEYIDDEQIEIGITSYSDFTCEKPHYHTQATEYQYMISGMTEYLDVETNAEYKFQKGDFYKIPTGLKYAQKSKPGTNILFIKTPPGNDKQDLEISKKVAEWLSSKVKTTRTDFADDPSSPTANSIKPAAAVAIINDKEEILLLRRRDSGNWTMPGGTLDFGEDLKSCATREVEEETGYQVEITDIIGTYTNPGNIIAYSDGEVRQEFTIVFSGTIQNGHLELDDESTAYQWIDYQEAADLPMAESQKTRIEDVISHYKKGIRAFK